MRCSHQESLGEHSISVVRRAEHDGVLSVTIWSVALNPSVGTSTVGGVEVVEKRFHSFWCIVAKELEACRQIIDRKQSQ